MKKGLTLIRIIGGIMGASGFSYVLIYGGKTGYLFGAIGFSMVLFSVMMKERMAAGKQQATDKPL